MRRAPLKKCLSRRAGMVAVLPFAAALSSCLTVGPDFAPPPVPDAAHATPEKPASPGEGQRFAEGKDIPSEWWRLFRSKPLDSLVKESIQNNPSLQASEAAVRIAYYNAEAQKGGFFPQLFLNSSDSTAQDSNNRSLSTINRVIYQQLYPTPANVLLNEPSVNTQNPPTANYALLLKQFTVSYTPDIWGRNARLVESATAQTENQSWQLEAAHLALTTNVVVAAIQEANIRGQIDATKNIITILRDSLEILNRQYTFGSIAKADVIAEEAEVAQAEETLPPLEKQLAIQRDLLTALAGRLSFEGGGETFDLAHFKLPETVPVSIPSQIVAQRPDIKAAEANLHQASADVGVAVANRLPNLTLSGNVGASAFKIAELFTPGTGLYVAAANLSQPIFDGMTLLNKQKAAQAALEQADAQYRSTVVNAFQNVTDALRSLQSDAKAVSTARQSEDAAKRSLDIVRMQLKYGQVSQIAVLNAQRTYFRAALSRVQAEATRLSDTAALFMALGGGWWNRGDPDKGAPAKSAGAH
jgi:NodT family efflux transporter outer membrane factor (OMF) lipoprotein